MYPSSSKRSKEVNNAHMTTKTMIVDVMRNNIIYPAVIGFSTMDNIEE